ncbi:hypothetical protein BD311DRAFT_61565 [Dichomitus squalens]|uniref:Uncharacterized protein n=1 Tax=Dichomitus squalens TaxID=114155 RepID=A0A4Q9M9F4_9APHY|nr:hypothetical protein BD311DRAFT_61565 [Dichomitus squalens]
MVALLYDLLPTQYGAGPDNCTLNYVLLLTFSFHRLSTYSSTYGDVNIRLVHQWKGRMRSNLIEDPAHCIHATHQARPSGRDVYITSVCRICDSACHRQRCAKRERVSPSGCRSPETPVESINTLQSLIVHTVTSDEDTDHVVCTSLRSWIQG